MAQQVPSFFEIEEHINEDDNAGWCTNCGDWTHDFCEPDAHHYECPECEGKTCYGAQELLIRGMFKENE